MLLRRNTIYLLNGVKMTKKLTFRELRGDLSKYLDRMEEGEVFEVRGKFLGFMEDHVSTKVRTRDEQCADVLNNGFESKHIGVDVGEEGGDKTCVSVRCIGCDKISAYEANSEGEWNRLMLLYKNKPYVCPGCHSTAAAKLKHRDPDAIIHNPHTIESDVKEDMVEMIKYYDRCYFCRQAVQLYNFFQEGSEYLVCEECLKNRLGKHAKKYICEGNKVGPREPIMTAHTGKEPPNPVFRQPAKIKRESVKYCTKCKCAPAQHGTSLCVKCGKKKKK